MYKHEIYKRIVLQHPHLEATFHHRRATALRISAVAEVDIAAAVAVKENTAVVVAEVHTVAAVVEVDTAVVEVSVVALAVVRLHLVTGHHHKIHLDPHLATEHLLQEVVSALTLALVYPSVVAPPPRNMVLRRVVNPLVDPSPVVHPLPRTVPHLVVRHLRPTECHLADRSGGALPLRNTELHHREALLEVVLPLLHMELPLPEEAAVSYAFPISPFIARFQFDNY